MPGRVDTDARTNEATKRKTVYFIRHAESEQNVAMRRLKRGEFTVILWLAYIGVDAPLQTEEIGGQILS